MKIEKDIEAELKLMKLEMKKTELKKQSFIQEIKNGLGDEIKKNPNKIIINKKSKLKKFINKLKEMFI